MSRKRRYTDIEDQIIIDNIKLYPTNLLLSFRVSSREIFDKLSLFRDKYSIQQRYYKYLRYKETIFTNESSNGETFINTKNTLVKKNDTVYDVIYNFKLTSTASKNTLIKTIFTT